MKDKTCFGKGSIGQDRTIVMDMSSPNIAKPFGIGHLRSTLIGSSIANICEFQGFKTVKINYLGDWGTQFGKLIVGYHRFGDPDALKIENSFGRDHVWRPQELPEQGYGFRHQQVLGVRG